MTRWSPILCGLWLASCSLDPVCDPGQRYELGSCLPQAPPPRDAGDEQDAGAATDATDATVASEDCQPGPGNYEGFGVSCESDVDCSSCVAPTCATAPINMCSRVQCQDDPNLCPPGWTCTDISAFSQDPAVTHICLK